MKTNSLFCQILAGMALFCSALVACAEAPPLKLGIMPFNSPLALLKTHQPLTSHLEKTLGRKVIVHTATDYFTHINQLLAGDFDIAITGPHFGAMAAGRGMRIIYRYAIDLQPVFVVRRDSPIHQMTDLRGKTLALSSRLSISSIGGIKWLQDQGFVLNKDFRLSEFSSHGAAVAAVVNGTADAALTTHTPLRQVPDDIRQQTRILASEVRVPHVMTLVHERLGASGMADVQQALASFEKSPAGQRFFQETGYQGYVAVNAADLQKLRPYVNLTVAVMRLAQ